MQLTHPAHPINTLPIHNQTNNTCFVRSHLSRNQETVQMVTEIREIRPKIAVEKVLEDRAVIGKTNKRKE